MAVTTVADLAPAFNLIFADDIADAIRRDIPLLGLLAVVSDRNETCTWTTRLTRAATARTDDGSDIVPADIGTANRSRAFLSWARYSNAFGIDGLGAAIASANVQNRLGTTVDGDAMREEAMLSAHDLAIKIGEDLYGGTAAGSPAEVVGVDDMAAGASYAGIDNTVGPLPEWTAATNTLAAADLDHATLRDSLIRPFRNANGRMPDFITCDAATFDRIGHFFGSDRRYVQEVRNPVYGVVNLQLIGGFNALMFDGVPIIEDRFATANKMYAWDAQESRGASIRQMPKYMQGLADITELAIGVQTLTGSGVHNDAVQARVIEQVRQGATRLQPTVFSLAKNGDSDRGQVVSYCQLRQKNRKCHAQLTLT